MLRRSDGPNLSKSSSLRLCVAILFLISRSPADQSTFVGHPSEDYRRYSVDNARDSKYAILQHIYKFSKNSGYSERILSSRSQVASDSE